MELVGVETGHQRQVLAVGLCGLHPLEQFVLGDARSFMDQPCDLSEQLQTSGVVRLETGIEDARADRLLAEVLQVDREVVAEDRGREGVPSSIHDRSAHVQALRGPGPRSESAGQFLRRRHLELGHPGESEAEEADRSEERPASDPILGESVVHQPSTPREASPSTVVPGSSGSRSRPGHRFPSA